MVKEILAVMPEIKALFIAFLAGCGTLYYIFRSGKEAAREEEKNKNTKETLNHVRTAKKIKSDNDKLTLSEIFDKLRSNERHD